MLYIICTPIGNLNDFSLRSINTLKQVDKIFAEDTRVAAKLLQHFEIKSKLNHFMSIMKMKLVMKYKISSKR